MRTIICGAALGMAAIPFVAGTALAAEDTQPPTQGATATLATAEQLVAQFMDASNGNGPSGADGVETEFPTPDPRFVEGPVGGLLNGPLD
ncbi:MULTISPECIES: hypothetical protein [Pseudonocardia]|uniref:Secreted protein n=1 Tax=Pseudonocardia oroxyli TaxID=366584 RepID=A0A1G7FVH8_PSEOR|nr:MULTISPECIES: hypothetical protein [Pseudonocardia]MCF7552898.1 hypothetical protein [Pseudonocardia sp. WMMC193]SDE79900.1 hypothetical protein SAMN05216377_102117 [Pseudonocardia oroxyli]